MAKRLDELAAIVNGEVVGDGSVEITGVASLSEARAGDLSFFADERYRPQLAETEAAGVLVREAVGDVAKNYIVVADPHAALGRVLALFEVTYDEDRTGLVHETAWIDATARVDASVTIHAHATVRAGAEIAAGCVIHPGAVIGRDVVVGRDAVIGANACIEDRCILGDRVALHSGVVIGADGFGYSVEKGVYHKIPQIGRVRIGNDVEIGANSTVDRGSIGDTIIGDGVKVDSQVQIAHNCTIGAHSVFAAHVGLAGSSTIGSWCRFGGKSGTSGHITVGDNVSVGAKSGVIHNVDSNQHYSGFPAREHRKTVRAWGETMRIGDLRRRVQELERQIKGLLEERVGATGEQAPPR